MKKSPFRIIPPIHILKNVLQKLHCPIESLPVKCTKEQIECFEWGNELVELLPYYMPSMIPRFFDSVTNMPYNTVTILRHLLRSQGYNLVSQETHVAYKKTIVYHLTLAEKSSLLEEEVVVEFE